MILSKLPTFVAMVTLLEIQIIIGLVAGVFLGAKHARSFFCLNPALGGALGGLLGLGAALAWLRLVTVLFQTFGLMAGS